MPIDVYNGGHHVRDFTYIDDIVYRCPWCFKGNPPRPDAQWDSRKSDPASGSGPYRVYNIGNNRPVELLKYIEVLEEALGKKAIINFQPLQKGDVVATAANIDDLVRDFGYCPKTPIEIGIRWFSSNGTGNTTDKCKASREITRTHSLFYPRVDSFVALRTKTRVAQPKGWLPLIAIESESFDRESSIPYKTTEPPFHGRSPSVHLEKNRRQ